MRFVSCFSSAMGKYSMNKKLIRRVFVRVGYVLLFLICLGGLAAGGLWLLIHLWVTDGYNRAYTKEAVNAYALFAAKPFSMRTDSEDKQYWDWSETPCIFETCQSQRCGNGDQRPEGEKWPNGSVPACNDFFVSQHRQLDMRRMFPRACIPVLAVSNIGGRRLSYVVLAANGANTDHLHSLELTADARSYLRNQNDLSFYRQTTKFVRNDGLDGVSLELLEESTCDGFMLFRYQAEVKDLSAMREKLKDSGYSVSIK